LDEQPTTGFGLFSDAASLNSILDKCPNYANMDDEGNINFTKGNPSNSPNDWEEISTIWSTALFKKWGFIPGTNDDEEKGWPQALKKMGAKGNMCDLCAVKLIYEKNNHDGADGTFASDIDEDLNSGDVKKVAGVFSQMMRRNLNTSTLPVDIAKAQNIAWWKKEFSCIFFTNSVVDNTPKTDPNGNIYIMIKSSQGIKYRLYHNHVLKNEAGDKIMKKKLRCKDESNTEMYESVEKKNLLEQGFDDSELTPKPSPTQTQTQRVRTQKPKPKYPPCQNGRYVLGCSSEVVRQVQECLGFMVSDQDGKFGKITQAALQKLGFAGGFTDKDVEKICKKVEADPSLGVVYSFDNPTSDNTTSPTTGVDNSLPNEVITNPR
jgi:hypothetical protein